MLYEVQNRNVFSLRSKVCVLLVWRTLSGRVFQTWGGEATILKDLSKTVEVKIIQFSPYSSLIHLVIAV